MSALAQQYGAINLAQGFPGFEVSEQLVDLVGTYMRKGVNQYSPIEGVLRLREVISQKQKTNITISAGESQVPNRDREKEGNPRMEQGDLAKNRMSELENVVKEKFGNLPNVTINKTEPVIGKTPWDPAKGAQDPNYTKEQFVNITLEISGKIDAPETNKPKCEKYDFYFKNRIYLIFI